MRQTAVETREVSFAIPVSDGPHIDTIVARAAKLCPVLDRMSTRMDLCATHANGCPMDFARLAEADDFNLLHDVLGIQRHMDRSDGTLSGFHPRFTKKQPSSLAA